MARLGSERPLRGKEVSTLSGRNSQKETNPAAHDGQRPGLAQDRFAADWDYLLANGPIDDRLFSQILSEISAHSQNNNRNMVLFLVTYGGLANDAYRIGRALQDCYDDLVIFIPSFCKSAGTLIACAANAIVMTPFAELGPLDVQLLKRDELFERRSGLITNYALEVLKNKSYELFEHFMLNIKTRGGSISFKMASEIASKITSDIMKNVYEHINVESIGEDERNLRVASEYCLRLDQKFRNLQKGAIDALVHRYVSHDFVIDDHEAKQLFVRVERPTETLDQLLLENELELMRPLSDGYIVKMLTRSISDGQELDAEVENGSRKNDETELTSAPGIPVAECSEPA